jgi:hypothetical protein
MNMSFTFTFALLVVLLSLVVLCLTHASAKELEVTDEWQVVGPEDTLPAGAHIRMDMTTGEKWVKNINPNDDDAAIEAASASATKVQNVEIMPDGSVQSLQQEEEEEEEQGTTKAKAEKRRSGSGSGSSNAVAVQEEPETSESEVNSNRNSDGDKKKYNYDAMHRALSKLSPEVLGDVPLPLKGDAEYEAQMNELWESRQRQLTELERLMELADVPKILKSYISSIRQFYRQQYLTCFGNDEHNIGTVTTGTSEKLLLNVQVSDESNILDRAPYSDMKEEYMNKNTDDDDQEDADASTKPEDDTTSTSTATSTSIDKVMFILNELEFLVTDIDMARDFHILGGWPVLASLLNPPAWLFPSSLAAHGICNAHDAANEDVNADATTDTEQADFRNQIFKLQSLSAWIIGNSVKNHAEFALWAVEPIYGNIDTLLVTKDDHEDLTPDPRAPRESSVLQNSTTVIKLLLDIIVEENDTQSQSHIHSSGDNTTSTLTGSNDNHNNNVMMQKTIYALTSLLRGNRYAQDYFLDMGGSVTLGTLLDQSSSSSISSKLSTTKHKHDMKLVTKIVTLAQDVLMEISYEQAEGRVVSATGSENQSGSDSEQHPAAPITEEDDEEAETLLLLLQQHQKLIDGFTSEPWCHAAWQLLQTQVKIETTDLSNLETTLQMLKPMMPHCSAAGGGGHGHGHDNNNNRQLVVELRDQWADVVVASPDNTMNIDEEWKQELVQLANDVLEELDKKQST